MRCRPFESAASELVDEGGHPVEQLEALEDKARELEGLGDVDAVIECRMKQLALQKLLTYLHSFPVPPLIRAEAALADAYAAGGYFRQSRDHLGRARKACGDSVFEQGQCHRLEVDILISEANLLLAEDKLDAAHDTYTEAAKLARECFGEMDARAGHVHTMLGRIAWRREKYKDAIEHFEEAWEVRENLDGGEEGEETIRLRLRIAECQYLDGRHEDAISKQTSVVESLRSLNAFPVLLVDSSAQLARWLEGRGEDQQALEVLKAAERTVQENLGTEDTKAVDIKRDVALLHLKLGDHETALQYLQDVHYFERRLHGSQSLQVARTLKALGTVHLVRRQLQEAEQCMLQALRIFEVEPAANVGIIRDIHAKLASIGANPRCV